MKMLLGMTAAALLVGATQAQGATVIATTCGRDQVAAALTSAIDGDTVVIPAGTCTWTTPLTITDQAVTIRGAGVDVTTIIDGTPKGLAYPSSQLLTWRLSATGLHRLTGLTIDGGTGPAEPYNKGIIHILGRNAVNFRMDHFKVIARRTAGVMFYDVLGVVDHGEFVMSNSGVPGPNKFALFVFHPNWQGVGGYGDNSWAQPTDFGTDRFLFVEDCAFTSDADSVNGHGHSYAVDGWLGQRVVYRRNTFVNSTWANHGTESSGRQRSARAAEIYDNDFVMNTPGVAISSAIGSRGGAALIHNNRLTTSNGAFVGNFIDLAVLRANQAFGAWGKCDGSSAWDQVAAPGGLRCLDQPGVGQGVLLSGDSPMPVGWPSQVSEPNHIWGNTRNGVESEVDNGVARSAPIREGRDFIRAPMAGYSAYRYPHPLTATAGTGPPAAPTRLRVVP